VTRKILVLRPSPEATAAAARGLGLEPVSAPLFTIRSLAWQAPDPSGFDAILLTSANAARHGGPGLAPFLALPCQAVGEATAAAARAAGFSNVAAGDGDGAAALAALAAAGHRRIFHPCGRDHIALEGVERRIIYAAEAATELPKAAVEALEAGALALVHSPRAGALFAALVDQAGLDRGTISIAAISPAATAAAGGGWRSVAAAAAPTDSALLELAADLCQNDGDGRHGL
jgi:uroporphyrinogen-III synthase